MTVNKETVLKVLGGILCTIFVIGWLGGCVVFGASMCSFHEEQNPSHDEYVGVWAAYEVKVDNEEFYTDSIDDVTEYLVVYKNGSAQEVVSFPDDEPFVVDSKWRRTTRDREEGTDAGILLLGDSFENPYEYFISPDKGKSYLVDEPLIGGFLCIDYGHRKVYLEKISDNPDDKPWLDGNTTSSDSAKSKNGSDGTKSQPGTNSIPAGAIAWNEASKHIGESVTVYGKVVDWDFASSSNGQPTFLDLGAPYPNKDRVTITIWGKDRGNFWPNPEALYYGESGNTVLVTGELYLYNGVCNIEVSSPSQIKVM